MLLYLYDIAWEDEDNALVGPFNNVLYQLKKTLVTSDFKC